MPLIDPRSGRVVLGVVGVLVTLAFWEAVVRLGVVPRRDVPPATVVLEEVARLFGTTELWHAVLQTLIGASLGLAAATAAGVPVGLLMGLSRAARLALRPTVEFLRPVPGIALIPLLILIWGQTRTTVWVLVMFGCVWPMMNQAFYGAQALDQVALDTAKSFRLPRGTVILRVLIPGTLPHIATGVRIGASLALIIAVSAELLTGTPGLGSSIVRAQGGGAFTEMYALVFASGLLGIALSLASDSLERHFLRWHVSQRGEGSS